MIVNSFFYVQIVIVLIWLLQGAVVDLYLKLTRDLRGKLIHPRGQ